MVNARHKLAICSTLNCNPSFAIGGNSIEFVDEWLHLGHMINKHFTGDMDINVKKTVVYTRVNGASHIENCKNYKKVITHQHIA